MTTYISILRGINVSGQKLINMNDLRKTYENLGFQSVITYVQSGNVVFKGKDLNPAYLEQNLSKQIKKDEFSLRLSTVTDEVISSDHHIEIHSVFFVDAKILGQ